jgi:hypothetical protein
MRSLSYFQRGGERPPTAAGQVVLDKLNRELERVVFDERRRDPPLMLWHFTSLAGLEGILSSKTIWATHYQSTNDRSELSYGDRLLVAQCRAIHQTQPALALKLFLEAFEGSRLGDMSEFFVASFCTEERDAAQWDRYGRSGTGVAVALRLAGIADLVSPTYGTTSSLQPLEYDNQEAEIASHVTAVLSLVERVASRNSDLRVFAARLGAAWLLRLAGGFLARLKDPAFRAEREWRLLHVLSKDESFERPLKPLIANAGGVHRARVEFPLCAAGASLPVEELVVGPCASAADERSIRHLAKSMLGQAARVRRSTVPLRR